MNAQALIPSDTIAETCAHRDHALELYRQYFEAMAKASHLVTEARAAVAAACGHLENKHYSGGVEDEVKEFEAAIAPRDVEQYLRVARRLVDSRVWGSLIERTDMELLMDREAKDELREQMKYVPERVDRHSGAIINQEEIDRGLPEVTVENVDATLAGLQEQAPDTWRRGLANAFASLDRRFRSHNGFKIGTSKIGPRVILTRVFDEWGGWNFHRTGQRDTLIDIERIFMVLDGQLKQGQERDEETPDGTPAKAYAGIVGQIDRERGRTGLRPASSEHESDYFKVRIFQNGNVHLWFKRLDLVEKVNRELAAYYGKGLGWDREPDEDREERAQAEIFETAVERRPARNFGLYPTPDRLAEDVIEAAKLWRGDGDPYRLLEPSAGTGQLAKRAAAAGAQVTAVEIQRELAMELRGLGLERVLPGDFLALEPGPGMQAFDRVVMNPPFDRHRDIDHVHHALKFLRPGGILVAIMSAGVEYSERAKARAFRAELKQHTAKWRDLPAGSFAEHGTNVNTVMLTVTKRSEG